MKKLGTKDKCLHKHIHTKFLKKKKKPMSERCFNPSIHFLKFYHNSELESTEEKSTLIRCSNPHQVRAPPSSADKPAGVASGYVRNAQHTEHWHQGQQNN